MTTNRTQRIFSISKSFQDVNTILDTLGSQERSRFICEAIMFYHQSKNDPNWLMSQFQTVMQPMMAMQQMMNPMFNQQAASLSPQMPLQTGTPLEELTKAQAEQLAKAQAEQLAKEQAEQLAKEQAELFAKAQAVEKAETTKAQADVDHARILVNALPDGADKTALTDRLDKVQAELFAKAQAELLATKAQAVEKAETTKAQADVDHARILVNVLPDGADKTALTDRLDKVESELLAKAQAELLAKKQAELLAGEVSAPQNLFNNQSQDATASQSPTPTQTKSNINEREDGLNEKELLKNRKKRGASAQFM